MSILIPDVASALRQTMSGAGSTASATRVPMRFTSTYRLRGINSQYQKATAKQLAPGTMPSIQNSSTPKNGILPIINMAVNPNSIGWKQSKRITKRDTQQGSIFFHFSNTNGENNDILTMDFRGNSGNIDSRGGGKQTNNTNVLNAQSNGNDTGSHQKLLIWHNLWALTREPMLLSDNTINQFIIMYSSVAIPIDISLIGHFNTVMDWNDSADKPFTKDYSFSFTVQEISPSINNILSDLQTMLFDPNALQAPVI